MALRKDQRALFIRALGQVGGGGGAVSVLVGAGPDPLAGGEWCAGAG